MTHELLDERWLFSVPEEIVNVALCKHTEKSLKRIVRDLNRSRRRSETVGVDLALSAAFDLLHLFIELEDNGSCLCVWQGNEWYQVSLYHDEAGVDDIGESRPNLSFVVASADRIKLAQTAMWLKKHMDRPRASLDLTCTIAISLLSHLLSAKMEKKLLGIYNGEFITKLNLVI